MLENTNSLQQIIHDAVKSQDWRYVVDNISILVKEYPEQLKYYNWEGNALLELEKFEEAKSLFERIAILFPSRPQGRFGRARVYIRTKQWKLALKEWDNLIVQFPNFHVGQCCKGNVLLSCGFLEEAVLQFEQLSLQYPDRFQGFYGLGRVSMAQQKWEKALEYFNYVTQNFPQFLQGYVSRANALALIALEDYDTAERTLRDVLGQHPDKIFG